jgi:hypothetical protein
MPGFNLVRNSRVFFTSDVNATTGVVAVGALTSANTQELSVLNGFSFSQNVDAQTITVSEAGDTPARGQRSFNTALQPVDFSFSTYMRPRGATTTVNMDEAVLWNALFSSGAMNLAPTGVTSGNLGITTTNIARTANGNDVTFTWPSTDITAAGMAVGDRVNVGGVVNAGALGFNGSGVIKTITGGQATCTAITVTMDIAPSGSGAPSDTTCDVLISKTSALLRNPTDGASEGAHVQATVGLSNKNQLQKFGLVIIIDQTTYVIDNCCLDQASVDFNLEGIATIQWTGKGTVLRTLAVASAVAPNFGGSLTGTFTAASDNTTGHFITNKVSTATLKSTFMGGGTSAKTYTIALTGGNLTIANGVSYITPETLGVVNKPIGYFTGTRAISGNVTAYLKTGGTNPTSTLLTDLLAASSETKYYLEIEVGGINSLVKVEFEMPAVTLQVPSVDVQDVVSTTINFTAQGSVLPSSAAADLADASTTSYYDVEAANDILVRYYSV